MLLTYHCIFIFFKCNVISIAVFLSISARLVFLPNIKCVMPVPCREAPGELRRPRHLQEICISSVLHDSHFVYELDLAVDAHKRKQIYILHQKRAVVSLQGLTDSSTDLAWAGRHTDGLSVQVARQMDLA